MAVLSVDRSLKPARFGGTDVRKLCSEEALREHPLAFRSIENGCLRFSGQFVQCPLTERETNARNNINLSHHYLGTLLLLAGPAPKYCLTERKE